MAKNGKKFYQSVPNRINLIKKLFLILCFNLLLALGSLEAEKHSNEEDRGRFPLHLDERDPLSMAHSHHFLEKLLKELPSELIRSDNLKGKYFVGDKINFCVVWSEEERCNPFSEEVSNLEMPKEQNKHSNENSTREGSLVESPFGPEMPLDSFDYLPEELPYAKEEKDNNSWKPAVDDRQKVRNENRFDTEQEGQGSRSPSPSFISELETKVENVDDYIARGTARNSLEIRKNFGPEPYFLSDPENFENRKNYDREDDGNEGKEFVSRGSFRADNRNEEHTRKFSVITDPDSFSSALNQRKSSKQNFNKKGSNSFKMSTDIYRNKRPDHNSQLRNSFIKDEVKIYQNTDEKNSFKLQTFQDNERSRILLDNPKLLSETTLAPLIKVFDGTLKEATDSKGRSSRKNIDGILELLNIRSNPRKELENGEYNSEDSSKLFSPPKAKGYLRDNGVAELRNGRNYESQEFRSFRNNQFNDNSPEYRNDRKFYTNEDNIRRGGNRELNDFESTTKADSGSGFNPRKYKDGGLGEFESNRNYDSLEEDWPMPNEERIRSRSRKRKKNSNSGRENYNARDNRDGKRNKPSSFQDYFDYESDLSDDQFRNFDNDSNENRNRGRKRIKNKDSFGFGRERDYDSAVFREDKDYGTTGFRENKDYDSFGYKKAKNSDFIEPPKGKNFDEDRFRDVEDYDSTRGRTNKNFDISRQRENQNYDSSGFKRGKDSGLREFNRNENYDSKGFDRRKNSDSRNSRRNKGNNNRPPKGEDNHLGQELPPLNFASLLESFEEEERRENFQKKGRNSHRNRRPEAHDVNELLGFIDGPKNKNLNSPSDIEIEEFREIVKNLNENPNFLSNLGFTYVNTSDLSVLFDPVLNSKNDRNNNQRNKNKDSSLSLLETLRTMKGPETKDKNTSFFNFNPLKIGGKLNNNLKKSARNKVSDKNKQSLSDLLNTFNLNTKPNAKRPSHKINLSPNLDHNKSVNKNRGGQNNPTFSTIRPESFKRVTEVNNQGQKKPYSIKPTQIPNNFGTTTPGSSNTGFGSTEVTSNFGNGDGTEGSSEEISNGKEPGADIPSIKIPQGGSPIFINSTVFVSTTPLPPLFGPIDYIPRLRTPSSLPPNVYNDGTPNTHGYPFHSIPIGKNSALKQLPGNIGNLEDLAPGINAVSNRGLFGINNPLFSPETPTNGIVSTSKSSIPTTPFSTTLSHTTPFPVTTRTTASFPSTPFAPTPSPALFPVTPRPTTPFSTTPYPSPLRSHAPTSPFPSTPGPTTPFSVTPGPTTPFSVSPLPTSPHSIIPQSRTPGVIGHPFPTTPRSALPPGTTASPIRSTLPPFSITPHPETQLSHSPYPTTFLPGTISHSSVSPFPTSPNYVTPFPGNALNSLPHHAGLGFPRPNSLPIVTSEVPPQKISDHNLRKDKLVRKIKTSRGRRLRARVKDGKTTALSPSAGGATATPTSTTTTATPITTNPVTLRTVPPKFAVRRRLRKKVRRKKKRGFAQGLQNNPLSQPTPSALHVKSEPQYTQLELSAHHDSGLVRHYPRKESLVGENPNELIRSSLNGNNFINRPNLSQTHLSNGRLGSFPVTPNSYISEQNLPSSTFSSFGLNGPSNRQVGKIVTPVPNSFGSTFSPYQTNIGPGSSFFNTATPLPRGIGSKAPFTNTNDKLQKSLVSQRFKKLNQHYSPITVIPFHSTGSPSPRPVFVTTPRPGYITATQGPNVGTVSPAPQTVTITPSSRINKEGLTPSLVEENIFSKDEDRNFVPKQINSINNLNSLGIPILPHGLGLGGVRYPLINSIQRVPIPKFAQGLGPYLTPYSSPFLLGSPNNTLPNSLVHPNIGLSPSVPILHSPGALFQGSPRAIPPHLTVGSPPLIYPTNLLQVPNSRHLFPAQALTGNSPALRKYYVRKTATGE